MERLEINESINIFDACSVINLIHIDGEDDFLLKAIKPLKPYLCEKVLAEITSNAKAKAGRIKKREDKQAFFRRTDKKISTVRNIFNLREDATIRRDFGDDFIEIKCKKIFNYTKSNGEFHSAVLALFLSRENACRVFFYTDDMPAKREFQPNFEFQQIGTIGDTVDFLVFLYWVSPVFKKSDLEKYLRDLYAEYRYEYESFLELIRNYRYKLPFKKKDEFKKLLSEIEVRLEQLDFVLVNNLIQKLYSFKRQHPEFIKEINSYGKIHELSSQNQNDYLTKLKNTIKQVKDDVIFKFI